jgi:MarR family 2-MHQ and catechol resistance regulon transcriptional repressor
LHLALQIVSAAGALEKAAKRVFAPHGLTPAQFNVINLLSDQPEGMRASDLAEALVVDPSNVTGLLKRMARDGWIVDRASPEDRRQHVTILAPKGRAAWAKARHDYEKSLRHVAAAVSAADRAVAEKAIASVVERAKVLK